MAIMIREYRIAIDFDNVVHSYTSPWSHAADIADPPLRGAIAWLERLTSEGARVFLHTCRFTQDHPQAAGFLAADPATVELAVRTWLQVHGLSDAAAARITMWTHPGKPYADAYVDDKAVEFTGQWHTVATLKNIVAANKERRIHALGA